MNESSPPLIEGVTIPPRKIVNGIMCFDDSGYFYSEISREDTLALSSLAARMGWKKAALGSRDNFIRKYTSSPNRSLFLSILPIGENDRILDVGAGWGTLPAQIAKGFPETKVYATDKTVERLFFAQQIKLQEHLNNLHVLQCDVSDLPFEKDFFDVVIMIGVLEWLGASVTKLRPRAAQEEGLGAILDTLKPGGRLLVGIENRVGYDLILGHADHSKRAYTSLMPRRVADAYMKLRGDGYYKTYTYTANGYRQLLKKVGFSRVLVYGTLPDYRFPVRVCDTRKVKDILNRRSAKIIPGRIIGAVVPSYYIIAEK